MAQRLRGQTTFPEDWHLAPSTHAVWLPNVCSSSLRGSDAPFWLPLAIAFMGKYFPTLIPTKHINKNKILKVEKGHD